MGLFCILTVSTSASWLIGFCILTVSMSASCHSFTRCHHWENWIKSKNDPSALFPTLHVNLRLSQNRKFNFKNRVRKTHWMSAKYSIIAKFLIYLIWTFISYFYTLNNATMNLYALKALYVPVIFPFIFCQTAFWKVCIKLHSSVE